MSVPNVEFIERCQIEYDRNPASRVFAPLAEAYRKMGLLKEALDLAQRGVKLHPDFAAGRIALARLFIEQEKHEEALEQLNRAAELSPDNILAFQLLGETHLCLRNAKEALKAFKMVLFLNPLHDRARKMVSKWEFLTADEFAAEDFDWAPNDTDVIREVDPREQVALKKDPTRADREAHRAISIADALTVRNDLEGAFATLGRSVRHLGARPDLEQRMQLLGRRLGLDIEEVQRLARESSRSTQVDLSKAEKKKQKLKLLLKRLDNSK